MTASSFDKLKKVFRVKGEIIFWIKTKPGAGASAVIGFEPDGALKIAVKARPEKGKANGELIKLIAREFGANPAGVKIISGATNRKKLIRINQGKMKK